MRSFAALESLRIGCVQYLNARPLIAAHQGKVIFEHPSRLAEMLRGGDLDVALVPTFEALHSPGFHVVDDVSISACGAVYSVFLAHHGRLRDVKTIVLDPASRTSTHLLRCLLSEFYGLNPNYVSGGEADARLLIGNQAICFRQEHGAACEYLDLGEEWLRRTGLPFVFAVWLIRPEVSGASEIADALRALKRLGLEHIDEIACAQTDFEPGFARRYLTENIHFDLGEKEKAGIARFRELLLKHRLLDHAQQELVLV